MSPLAAFAVYFVIWWTVLFCVLPLNVQSQSETGNVTTGTEPGAPVAPQLWRKANPNPACAPIIPKSD